MPPDFTCIEKAAEETKPDYVKKFQTLPKIDITNSSNNPFKEIPELKPNSKCPPFIPKGLTCAGVNCETVININGCQECKCEEDCPILKCGKGCGIYATTPGVCPQCQC